MNFLTALIAGAAVVTALTVPESGKTLKTPSGKELVLIPKNMNRKDAEAACQAAGGSLAALETVEDIKFMGEQTQGNEAWVGSFLNQKNINCIAVFSGGAIAEPIDSCNANLHALCQ